MTQGKTAYRLGLLRSGFVLRISFVIRISCFLAFGGEGHSISESHDALRSRRHDRRAGGLHPGGACRGIIRVSGPRAVAATSGLFEPEDEGRWRSTRFASRMRACCGCRLCARRSPLRFIGGRRVAVTPGSRSLKFMHPVRLPLLEAVLAALYERGVRPATAGEFTLRAFLSGRIDLIEAEAVLGRDQRARPAGYFKRTQATGRRPFRPDRPIARRLAQSSGRLGGGPRLC